MRKRTTTTVESHVSNSITSRIIMFARRTKDGKGKRPAEYFVIYINIYVATNEQAVACRHNCFNLNLERCVFFVFLLKGERRICFEKKKIPP